MPLAVFFGIEISSPNASISAFAAGDTARVMKAITHSCGTMNIALKILSVVVFIVYFSLIDLECSSWMNRSLEPLAPSVRKRFC